MITRMKKLVSLLREASKAYYQEAREIMSNKEYDALYDELLKLERETGVIMSNSPTHTVGYEVISELPKEKHKTPMQSLDKTKDVQVLKSFLGTKDRILSWKLDGLTVVLTYINGELSKAVTRGNGEIGELITNNVKKFSNIPLTISSECDILVVRGEAVITYPEFERINSETSLQYKNPRNLCSGTVRQLNNEIVADRNVRFVAFELLTPQMQTVEESFDFLEQQGFEVVEHRKICGDNFDETFNYFKEKLTSGNMEIPTDGLVIRVNDNVYGESLGRTDKFPRHSLAFKWADEVAPTTLINVEWNTSRTGLVNPVAVFEPVELEGTTVERASLHNVSYVKQLHLGLGDEITVYKANMIIPQIDENLTQSGTYVIPNQCPTCGAPVEIKREKESEAMYCTNPNCKAKLVARLAHFVSRECMNIRGLSDETLKKMIDSGWIDSFDSLYRIKDDQKIIREMMRFPGLGRTSVNNILDSIEKSRNVRLDSFITSLGIPGVGKKQAKQIAQYFKYDYEKYEAAVINGNFNFRVLEGFGNVLCENILMWYQTVDKEAYKNLVSEMNWIFPDESISTGNTLAGKIFVITGSLEHYSNRQELQQVIESAGGKVSGSITSKTSYLINNNPNSTSSKNQKANQLHIPIITEKEFMEMVKEK